MRSTNRKRALLVSGSVILLCMTIIVGMTWALFTDTRTLTNHLKAGDLSITLVRKTLTKAAVYEDGKLNGEITYDEKNGGFLNFTEADHTNIFKLANENAQTAELVLPGSYYTAEMVISSDENDVDCIYWLGVVVKDAEGNLVNVPDSVLNGVIDISVKVDNGTDNPPELRVSDYGNDFQIGTPESPLGTLTKGSEQTFYVTMRFVDNGYDYNEDERTLTSVDNDLMGKGYEFDIVVYAVQKTNN